MSRHFTAQARMFFPIVLTVGFLGLLFLTRSTGAARSVMPNASYLKQVAAARISLASMTVTATTQTNATASNTAFPLAWSSYETERTSSVALGDYDGDGDLDLAVGNIGYGTIEPIRLYRNEGGMLTTNGVWASTDGGADSLAWGDVDGDGDLDLVAVSMSGSVRLYRNDDSLLTTSAAWSSVDGGGASVAWGDVDGDGDLDLAVGDWGYLGSNRLYRNDGGRLTTSAVWSSADGGGYSIAWGDVDGDGDLDLATGFSLYRNENGTLTTSSIWSPVDGGGDVTAWGDMDGDGDLDLAVGALREPRLYRNDGGMLTTSAVWLGFSEGSSSFTTVAWGDYDGDGDLDLAVGYGADEAGPPNQIYRNDGVANNGSPAFVLAWSSAELDDTQSIAWGDVDDDGDLDLVVGNDNQPNRLYRNDGGTLATYGEPSPVDCLATAVAWGDIDNDGDLDLAVGGYHQSQLYRNVGDTLLTNAVWSSVDGGSWSVAWGDVDGDGDLDLAAARDDRAGLYRNDNGTLTTSAVWWPAVANWAESVAWGDVDGDGDLDLAAGSYLYRNDNGTLTTNAVWSAADGNDGGSVAWGDYDGDGDLDLAVGHKLYRNDNGTLTSNAIWSAAGDDLTRSIAWGDVDGDGDLDLAVGNWYQPNRLYRNDNGKLTPNAVWSSVEAEQTASVAWGDMDSDGDLDLAVANGENSDTPQLNRIYRNDYGVLTASATWSSSETEGTSEVAWGDLDGDGDLDLAVGNRSDGPCYRVYHNTRDARLLPGNIPTVRVARPGPNADLFSSPKIWSGLIPITYTLADAQGEQVKRIRAWYSPDGGGYWLPAAAATGTMTTNLGTTRFITRTYTNNRGAAIPDLGKLTSTLTLTPTDMIADIDIRLNVAHTWDQDLVVQLTAPFSRSAVLVNRRGGDGDNLSGTVFDDEAATPIRLGVAPFTGRYRPEEPLSRFDGYAPKGVWQLTIADMGGGGYGTLLSWGMTITLNTGRVYTYIWDVGRSGVFGQLDNAVVRIQAVPGMANTTQNAIPGPYLYGANASQTFPFRVRGTQVRVLSGTVPISNAVVYRLPAGQSFGALPFADLSGAAYHTDGQGYLQGRGQMGLGDRLVALAPITATDAYTLYYTSAAPTLAGLNLYTVTQAGVQTLVVSSRNPLLLFNLDLSLEWDARQDTQFLSQFHHDVQRASEFLYDWSNGQAALGQINLYFDREKWDAAHIRLYASNRLRPNAEQGGLVTDVFTDPITSTITYNPGQVRMGAVWTRYGDNSGALGEDWPRALAHELSHYVLFLDDDYLGLDANNRLVPLDTCGGTAMSDPYREDYSEYRRRDTTWQAQCGSTLAAKETSRADWETVTTMYHWLSATVNAGPSSLPLNVTQMVDRLPITPTTVLPAPIFNLTQAGAKVQPGPGARAILYQQSNRLIDLGNPTLDQVTARGARLGDRLCVYEASARRLGCETLTAGDEELALVAQPDWQPEIVVTPVNSQTINLRVNVAGLPPTMTLRARLYPVDSVAASPITLVHPSNAPYSGTFQLAEPAPQGYVQVWVNEPEPRRESVIDYALGGNPAYLHGRGAYLHGRGAYLHGRGAYLHGRGAPAQSSDGQVLIFGDGLIFNPDEYFALQAMTGLPAPLPGRTLVGQAYRLLKSAGAPSLSGASISFSYAGREVPAGEETFLRVYFWDGSTWQPLPTTVNTAYNVAVAPTQDVGVYALLSSIEIPLYGPGWDLFAYPVQVARPVTDALQSIDSYYHMVYGYEAQDLADPWKVYAVGVPSWVNDLHALRFGEAYWISLTQSITLNLSSGLASDQAVALQSPPATYYGAVLSSGNFIPTTGMNVTAWIDRQACGQGVTQLVGGQIVYSLNVIADGPGGATGCGAPGRTVVFTLSGQPMTPHSVWSNDAMWNLSLRRGYDVYLPLLKKG